MISYRRMAAFPLLYKGHRLISYWSRRHSVTVKKKDGRILPWLDDVKHEEARTKWIVWQLERTSLLYHGRIQGGGQGG